MSAVPPEPAQDYLLLRSRILSLNPDEMGLAPTNETPHVWGIVTETGYDVGSATLISLADGTTSLYFSTGGGMLGSSEYIPLAEAAKALVAQAEILFEQMTSTIELPLPEVGTVRFTILTYTGNFSTEAPLKILSTGQHSMSSLFTLAQATLEQLRLLSEKKRKSL
ncbi:MAG: hypothetical protein A2Z71_07750 [Chloroflexi bacterium RBG_13_50_21]|nr:MAG: hypothetical protein A2Z71_07750 [Chloroflexi bacterium RBG_13_50_21]OGO64779.1 MAG: hypothetical protein A2030_07995 [Chloroflexi bacterium RBG_19FT_COMBO_50_10]